MTRAIVIKRVGAPIVLAPGSSQLARAARFAADAEVSADTSTRAAADIARQLGTISHIVYPTTPVPTGTNTADASHYVWPTTQGRGYVLSVELDSVGAGTLNVGVYTKTGDVFDRVRYVAVEVPGSGVQTIPLVLEKGEDELIGVEVVDPTVRFQITGGPDPGGGWYTGATVPFTDAATIQIYPFSIRFEIAEITENVSPRPTSVDLPWANMMVIGMGQSLMEGSQTDTNGETPITTAQEYDTVCFPAYPADPDTLLPATTANSQRDTPIVRGEWSGLGCAKQFRDALNRDHNISYLTTRSRIVIANNGYDGRRLDQINQGTVYYDSAVAQAAALGPLTGETSGVLAVIFAQGESDALVPTDPATYKGLFKEFATDIDADLRAATAQAKRIPTVSYQLGSIGRPIGLAHLAASLESPLIVLACPMYQFEYYDDKHIVSAAERHMGGYFGEAIAQWAAGVKFEPLRPIASRVLGNTVVMTFNKTGLEFDTTLVAAQTRNGFSCVMGDGVTANHPTAQAVINGNEVRLTFASPPDSGATISYGVAASGLGTYGGGAGNLRDRAGDARSIDGFALHNWCVLFDWVL